MDEIDISGLQVGGEGGGPLTADDILPLVARRDAPDEFAEEMVVLAGDPVRAWKITPFKGDAMRFPKGAAETRERTAHLEIEKYGKYGK